VLQGTFVRYPIPAIIATTGIILAALYILLMYQRTMTGEPPAEVTETMSEINTREKIAIIPVAAIIIALGVFPQVLLNVINPTIDQVMTSVSMTDPVASEGVSK
jgi:NADH-quinone oxidoreductase subunit M